MTFINVRTAAQLTAKDRSTIIRAASRTECEGPTVSGTSVMLLATSMRLPGQSVATCSPHAPNGSPAAR